MKLVCGVVKAKLSVLILGKENGKAASASRPECHRPPAIEGELVYCRAGRQTAGGTKLAR